MSKKIKTLSLFSGAGGLDIGFHSSGFNIVGCVELENKYCKTLTYNRDMGSYFGKRSRIHNLDVREFDVTQYLDEDIECVIGGPPCQTFSAAGRRSGGVIGTDDLRGQLYESYCKILSYLKPRVFIFENVYGLPGAEGGKPWAEIQNAFKQLGYDLNAEVFDTADYGVPQHRERLIMVGIREGEKKFTFPTPTHGPDSSNSKGHISVLDAIADIQPANERSSLGLGGLYGHLLPEVPEGLNYAYFTAEMGHPEPVFAWRSKFHDLLYKVDRNKPCRTIKASPGKFTGPLHWKNRHFTTAELKRLQTFPDDYSLVGSYGQIVEQIGNSVPPKFAEVIATSVKEQVLRPIRSLTYQIRTPCFVSTFRRRQRERSKQFKEVAHASIKAKYGRCISYEDNEVRIKPKTIKFHSRYLEKFEREEQKNQFKELEGRVFSSVICEAARFIRIDTDQIHPAEKNLTIDVEIEGLKKYLPHFSSLKLEAIVSSVEDIFPIWKEIERSLIQRSQFFTLIDIYGHYANRGDVVNVKTRLSGGSDEDRDFLKFLEYFGATNNCGTFVTEDSIKESFRLGEESFRLYVDRMRGLRFDVRTHQSHPIIENGLMLCTYPFPLLSKKAMVSSKADLQPAF
ncbi:MAG: DNA (cytosine-5-)-methyltransferase [Opitutaceae bacterium]